MVPHAPRHDHDASEGDDNATDMLPPVPDVHAQARPIPRRPRSADASPADADVTASHPQVAADVAATGAAEVQSARLLAERACADVAIMAVAELIALKLLGQDQRLVFGTLAALVDACEEDEAPYHSAAPAIQRPE